jgi:hypothetical protein
MGMPDEKELDTEALDEGHETEADAGTEPEQGEVGADSEDAAESDGSEVEGQEVAAAEEDKPRSRAAARIEKLSTSAREATERAAAAETKARDLEARLARLEQPRETPEQVAQRMALMTPEERLEYKLDQAERRNQQNMQAMSFQMQETADKTAFQALRARDSVAERYADRVEAELARLRTQGQNVSREALLDYMVGKDIRSKSGSAKKKQQGDGERRIARQTAQPGNARGDSAPAKRGEKSLEERLENVTF